MTPRTRVRFPTGPLITAVSPGNVAGTGFLSHQTLRARTSVLNRFLDPLRDHRRVVSELECHGAVESLRSGDQHSYAAPKWIRGNPGFEWLAQMTTGGFDGRLDPLPLGGWDSFAGEHCQWHSRSVLWLGRSHCIGPQD